jgi:hypothetical protein
MLNDAAAFVRFKDISVHQKTRIRLYATAPRCCKWFSPSVLGGAPSLFCQLNGTGFSLLNTLSTTHLHEFQIQNQSNASIFSLTLQFFPRSDVYTVCGRADGALRLHGNGCCSVRCPPAVRCAPSRLGRIDKKQGCWALRCRGSGSGYGYNKGSRFNSRWCILGKRWTDVHPVAGTLEVITVGGAEKRSDDVIMRKVKHK